MSSGSAQRELVKGARARLARRTNRPDSGTDGDPVMTLRTTRITPAVPVVVALFASCLIASPAHAQNQPWISQFGTTDQDHGRDVAVDTAGNAYVVGDTMGSLNGLSAGASDGFLARFDESGTLLWTRQIGTSASDYATAVAVDGAGNAYICGDTYGNLGGPLVAANDVFLAKYDASGAVLWTTQFGTYDYDWGRNLVVDEAGDIYVTGHTGGGWHGPNYVRNDAFLIKLDPSGKRIWKNNLGTQEDEWCSGLALDNGGNVYIC